MSNFHRRPRDELGWRVPREGTGSRVLYDLMRQGIFKPAEIAQRLGCSRSSVKVKMHRIRHPDRPRLIQAGAKLVARGKLKTKTRKPPPPSHAHSRYVLKLITILGMTPEEAQRIERELIEKENNKANEERTSCQRVANATSAN